ncbi:hypothetical protein L1987_05479 [Smallanthus sonchifolius]|uniref:Uncharacterized protein n=1 Tax=Smallanthus sonchifolius TaxID=185202 RepID=A0ACB9JVJ6_9ASTR|nr:hypothetical protein L1987_05479 [Smallanthus sonchifolius]
MSDSKGSYEIRYGPGAFDDGEDVCLEGFNGLETFAQVLENGVHNNGSGVGGGKSEPCEFGSEYVMVPHRHTLEKSSNPGGEAGLETEVVLEEDDFLKFQDKNCCTLSPVLENGVHNNGSGVGGGKSEPCEFGSEYVMVPHRHTLEKSSNPGGEAGLETEVVLEEDDFLKFQDKNCCVMGKLFDVQSGLDIEVVLKEDDFLKIQDKNCCVMGKVFDVQCIENLLSLCEKEGFNGLETFAQVLENGVHNNGSGVGGGKSEPCEFGLEYVTIPHRHTLEKSSNPGGEVGLVKKVVLEEDDFIKIQDENCCRAIVSKPNACISLSFSFNSVSVYFEMFLRILEPPSAATTFGEDGQSVIDFQMLLSVI